MSVEMPTADEPVRLVEGDCLDVLRALPDGCADAVVTDPPYGLEFMGKEWDSPWKFGISETGYADAKRLPRPSFASSRNPICRGCGRRQRTWDGGPPPCGCESPAYDQTAAGDMGRFQEWCYEWAAAALRALKPGGYAIVFGGTRTYHRLTCAVEDAGFEVRDCLMWLYGSGFPKHKACLKPAWEPILLARKPGRRSEPLNIDECRVASGDGEYARNCSGDRGHAENRTRVADFGMGGGRASDGGRWPANVTHDGSEEVLEAFAAFGERPTSKPGTMDYGRSTRTVLNAADNGSLSKVRACPAYGDTGTAARFFYCAKASKADRGPDNRHPTVKPLALMRWLARLIACPGGLVLDPFAGSGTTGVAARAEGRRCLLIERDPDYCDIIRRRLAEPAGLFTGKG